MNNKQIAKLVFAASLAYSMNVQAQSGLTGRVKTSDGAAVPFAVVGISNSQLSATANSEGVFRFPSLKNGAYVFITKSLGYTDRSDTLTVDGGAGASIDIVLSRSNRQLDEVVVNATRVDKNSGMAFSNVDSETLKKQNTGQDAPYMLNQLTGVVVNSDAGNAVGYTGIRIRGSDATRINVTINGVPINDAESQGMFFVNMPDLVSSINNIQVQRGVGASSNGAGAFGASINFQTNELKEKPYANVISTAGSYDTYRTTLAAGTGLLNDKFTVDARASRITSSGYIDRASSNLQSYYLAAGYYGKKSVLKFINFLGQEKTYQAWNLVPEDSIRAGNRTYNSCGEYVDENGVTRYYKNETDNYKQNNFQLHFVQQISPRFNFNVTGHYTKGRGYYEQYKTGRSLSDYMMENVITPKGDTITSTDLVRRLWLDNDFAGGIFNLNYLPGSGLSFALGGGYNSYYGRHFDRVVWARYASNSELDHEYDHNTANKTDGNVYLKTNYKPFYKLNVFLDLQVRRINYSFLGFDNSFDLKMQSQEYVFFNPKLGLSYDLSQALNLYASLSVGNKEPNRNDFVQSSPQSRPKSEQLMDLEAGAKYAVRNLSFSANIYNMQYKDQLVLNGELNDVGASNRVNVASSYRRGIELEISTGLGKYFSAGGNLALSQNKIATFTEYVANEYGDSLNPQHIQEYKNTDISFSPNIVSSAQLVAMPVKGLEIALINKYVGRQFLDNTGTVSRSINPYNVVNLRINYSIKTRLIPEIMLMLTVYNVLNTVYETNGATYAAYYAPGVRSDYNYLAPAAPVNFMGGVSLKF